MKPIGKYTVLFALAFTVWGKSACLSGLVTSENLADREGRRKNECE